MQCTRRLRKQWSAKDATLNLNLRAVWEGNQSATTLRSNFCLSLVCSFPGKFHRTHKSIFGRKTKAANGANGGLRPCEEIQRILVSKIPVYCSAILFSLLWAKIFHSPRLKSIGMFCVLFSRHIYQFIKGSLIFFVSFLQSHSLRGLDGGRSGT